MWSIGFLIWIVGIVMSALNDFYSKTALAIQHIGLAIQIISFIIFTLSSKTK